MTRVKICGMRRVEDARARVRARRRRASASCSGRRARASSTRSARARSSRALPPFVVDGRRVRRSDAGQTCWPSRRDAGLTAVQLHGDEDAAAYRGMPLPRDQGGAGRRGLRRLSAVAGSAGARRRCCSTRTIRSRRGGTGRTIDWTVAAAAARLRPVILSGGLNAENVAERDRRGAPVRRRRVVGRRVGARRQGRRQAARVLRARSSDEARTRRTLT